MKTARRLSISAVATLSLAALFAISSAAVRGDNAQTLTGTWLVWPEFAPGLKVPALHTYHSDGTLSAADTFSGGGIPGLPIRTTPNHGVWERTGPASFAVTSLFLVYDAGSSLLVGFGRARASVLLTTPEADRGTGVVSADFLACPSPVTCPDPTAADAAWMPFPNFPPEVPVTSTRVNVVQ
jgi:hypothetical protein